jgi:hypothetical protein
VRDKTATHLQCLQDYQDLGCHPEEYSFLEFVIDELTLSRRTLEYALSGFRLPRLPPRTPFIHPDLLGLDDDDVE